MTDDAPAIEIAQRLYALPLKEFVDARNAASKAAKESGDTDLADRVRAFKKPAAGADLVNHLVRGEGALMQDVHDLGPRLRAAQSGADAAELRDLDRERRALVGRCVAAAGRLVEDGGPRATSASLRDVEQTVWAALVDAGASAVLRTGTLIRPLSPSGFGTVDIADASAVPISGDEIQAFEIEAVESAGPPRARRSRTPTPPAPSTRERKADREAVRAAEHDAAAAEERLSESTHDRDIATQAADDTREAIDRLDQELADLRDRTAAAKRAKQLATSRLPEERASLRGAERDRRRAATDVERARQRVEELRDQR